MKHHKAASSSTLPSIEDGGNRIGEPANDSVGVPSDATCSTRDELIRQGAYALYEARNGEDGTAMDDWLQAERALDQNAARLAI